MKSKVTVNNIIAYLFVLIIMLFMFGILLRMCTKNVLVEMFGINNTFTQFILKGMNTSDTIDEVTGELYEDIDWEELYPFSMKYEEQPDYVQARAAGNGMMQKIGKIKGVIDDYCTEYLFGRVTLVEGAYSYENLLGWSLIPFGSDNGIIVKENGYLTYVQPIIESDSMVKHVSDFNEFLKEYNISLLYIQAPSKINPIAPELPAGVKDYTNDNIDRLLQGLEQNEVDYIDLRNFILDSYHDYEEAFYKTDHHWKTTTAFGAVKYVAEYLNEQYNFAFDNDLYNDSHYNIAVYEQYFLGSQGKKITLGVAKPEDYQLVEPLIDTDFSVQIPERRIDISGVFGDTLLDYRHLQTIDYYGENCYASFMNRNDAYAKIINNAPICNKDKKILIIKDSYSTPFVPYLALGVGEIDAIYELLFTGSIRTFVEQEQPDMVIVMYAPNSMSANVEAHSSFFNLE